MKKKKIAIIGAGIAGVTCAIGLKKLGFDVVIIYKKRVFEACEGFSERTKDGLRMMNCLNTASCLNTKSLRNSNWANTSKSVNYEYVVSRRLIDEALLKDAKAFDIELINASVSGKIDFDDKVSINYKKDKKVHNLSVDFVVDARGRFTPYQNEYTKGPKSFSLLQELEVPKQDKNKTSIDSIKKGWVWQAYVGKNKAYFQFTCDESIAKNIKCFDDILPYLKNKDLDLWTLKEYKIKNKLIKRDSFNKIHKTIVNDKMILVGDSASSIDPLSGNGVFQAMSMSSIAPYVINTILNKKEDKNLAIKFYKKRVNYIFEKFSNTAKEFYKMEKRFDDDFWKQRQNYPLEDKKEKDSISIEKGAIVKDDFIQAKEVIITKNNPLGIYFLGNIQIVELVKTCLKDKENASAYLENFCKDLDEDTKARLKHWFAQNILR